MCWADHSHSLLTTSPEREPQLRARDAAALSALQKLSLHLAPLACSKEIERWERLSADEIDKFRDEDGLLNEFALVWQLRDRFPLHLIVFKQTACHLCHEANVEQIFSRAGLLSDPNIDQDYLATLVMISCNKKAFQPTTAAIKAKYYELFRG